MVDTETRLAVTSTQFSRRFALLVPSKCGWNLTWKRTKAFLPLRIFFFIYVITEREGGRRLFRLLEKWKDR